jgi:uncharacterized membrane protein YphA (DoxX/SURF4 family)
METLKQVALKSLPVLRVLLGLLFIYAGAAKMWDIPAFSAQLQRFGLQHSVLAGALAYYLPALEIACGAALVVRRYTIGALIVYITLLSIFEVGLAYAWSTGVRESCGCFGKFFGGASIPAAFMRNLVLMAVAAAVMLRELATMRRTPQ